MFLSEIGQSSWSASESTVTARGIVFCASNLYMVIFFADIS